MKKISVKEMVIFAFLGALMFVSKLLFEVLPNIHMLAMCVALYTVVYRKKALIPIYVFVLLEGLFYGFTMWWIPYLYIWTILWATVMLLPKKMPARTATLVYMLVCALHGLSYGTLYAPFQALWMGYDFRTMLAWIATGFPWDVTQAVGNFAFGTLVYPLSKLLKKLSGDNYEFR